MSRVVLVVAATMVAVVMAAGPVVAASSSPWGGAGTAAIPSVLRLGPGVQVTSGLKNPELAGYAVTPSALVTAKATIKIPLLACAPSGGSGIAPGVWLDGFDGWSGAYALQFCNNGQVTYDAAAAINTAQTVLFTVKPGDTVVVSVSQTASKSLATVHDLTSGMSKTLSGAGGDATQALVGDGGVTFGGVLGGVPRFKSYPVSSASVGGQALGSVNPVSVERVNGKIVQLVPTAITGGNAFKVVFKHT
jgi:hypothetical protein